MPEFPADREPRLSIDFLLRRCQVLRARAAGGLHGPASEFAVARLRILVAMSVNTVTDRIARSGFGGGGPPEVIALSVRPTIAPNPANQFLRHAASLLRK